MYLQFWVGYVARMEEGGSAFKILTGNLTGKKPSRRPRRILEDKIRVILKEMGFNGRNWDDSAQDRNYWRVNNKV